MLHQCRDRGFEQVSHLFWLVKGLLVRVIVPVLGGIENPGRGAEGGVGDLGADGGLPVLLVPQDVQAERVERPARGPLNITGRAGSCACVVKVLSALVK
jgi:hypothetical protein